MSMSISDNLNNSNLKFADEHLTYLSKQLGYIISAIYSDLAIGTTMKPIQKQEFLHF
jgi:hypothetical protein